MSHLKKIILTLILLVGGTLSCTQEPMSYHGDNRIEFSSKEPEIYTFAYLSKEYVKDTVYIPLHTVGNLSENSRLINFKILTKDWEYIYDDKKSNLVIDSVMKDIPFLAKEGVHFNFINAKEGKLLVPAGSTNISLAIEVLRNDSKLQRNAHKLLLQLLPTTDFQLTSPEYSLKRVSISDKLEKPVLWKTNNYYVDLYLGEWSEVKHRFMIDVTGQKWDNPFIRYYVRRHSEPPVLEYYMLKIKKALEAYNSDPTNNPPLKDENGKEVVFP